MKLRTSFQLDASREKIDTKNLLIGLLTKCQYKSLTMYLLEIYTLKFCVDTISHHEFNYDSTFGLTRTNTLMFVLKSISYFY